MRFDDVYVSGFLILCWLADSGRANTCPADHRSCRFYEARKGFYCRQRWLKKRCKNMCGFCKPKCEDHKICKYYEAGKTYYCKHQWMNKNCRKMCGFCTDTCATPDHISCSNYMRRPNFYCPHAWLKKNCNQMCGRCADKSGLQWPQGQYGILSRDRCPAGWYEFNHCMDTENDRNKDDFRKFKLRPTHLKCDRSSLTFRYCFKGPTIPTRSGGFWTNYRYNGFAYVIRNSRGACSEFGSDGGMIQLDNEMYNNKNTFGNNELNGRRYHYYHPYGFVFEKYTRTRLSFCKIGEKGSATSSSYIVVGRFNNQKFGFLVKIHQACPTVNSPYGVLSGSKQNFFTDDENYYQQSKIIKGDPPVVMTRDGTKWSVCQYNPKKGMAIS